MLLSRRATYPRLGNPIFSPRRIRMSIQKVFVIESDVTNNTKPICNNAKLVGVTKMPIDVHLLDSLIRSSMGRHGTYEVCKITFGAELKD